jgi:hypothetical protein
LCLAARLLDGLEGLSKSLIRLIVKVWANKDSPTMTADSGARLDLG